MFQTILVWLVRKYVQVKNFIINWKEIRLKYALGLWALSNILVLAYKISPILPVPIIVALIMTKIIHLVKNYLEPQQPPKTRWEEIKQDHPWILQLTIRQAFYSPIPHVTIDFKRRNRHRSKKK